MMTIFRSPSTSTLPPLAAIFIASPTVIITHGIFPTTFILSPPFKFKVFSLPNPFDHLWQLGFYLRRNLHTPFFIWFYSIHLRERQISSPSIQSNISGISKGYYTFLKLTPERRRNRNSSFFIQGVVPLSIEVEHLSHLHTK